MGFCEVIHSQTLPAGFSTSVVGSGWALPMGTAFTNDGQRLFVWEKDGRVFVCNRNAAGAYIKQSTPVLNIAEEVGNWGDYGLLGFTLDPNFQNNGLIYLLYVVDRHYLLNFGTGSYNPATTLSGATIGRVTRYKTITSGSNLLADPGSRMILLGESKSTGFPILHDSHGVGSLAFAADGTLLVTCGDGASYYLVDKGSDTDTDFQEALTDGIIRPEENVGAFRSQMLNSHSGKLLRIDPVTGNGVSSNPYYSAAQPRSAKSRVWALGLRNPYRFSVKPGTGSTNPAAGDIGEIYVGDVGWNTYEEVNVISRPGVNCGWPLFEGLTPQPGYTSAITANREEPNPLFGIGGCSQQFLYFQDLIKQATADNNKTVYNSCNPATPIGSGDRFVHHRPMIDWRHFTNDARVGIFSGNAASTAQIGSPASNVIGTPFPGNCVTGGPWYSGSNFPAAFNDRYFVADHDANWIKCFSVDFTDVVTEVKNFGSGFSGIVSLTMNPLDGTLFIVELGNFSTIPTTIKQVRYGGNQAPVVKMTSDKTYGPSVLGVNFSGNASSDPDGSIASYAWNFGDGGTSAIANPSHNFTAPANTPAKYVVKLTVTDNLGASSVDSIIISVNNTPPVVNITSPIKNSLYKIGPDTTYACTATVTDAEHTSGQLKYEWQTFLRHNSHAHPEPISTSVGTSTHISRIGCNGDDYYWLIKLTVTDAAGLSAVDSSKIFPDCNPGADNTPPVVSTVSPLNGAINISTGTTVSAIFNETIDPVTVTGTTFQLKNASNSIIPASINTSFNQLTLTPSAVLPGSTIYTVTIKGGVSGVKDLAGNALVNDYSWTFTTVAVDITTPVVTSVSPVNGATTINTGTTVIANFNEAINASTINGTTFELRNAGNNIIAATVSTSSNQIILIPSAALTGSTVYTATIKGGTAGVKDLSGNAMVNDFAWTFTTGAVDNISPTVLSVLPVNAAIGVSTETTVSANFSEPVNPLTVTGTTVQLKDPGNNVIAASLSILSNEVRLIPSSPLVGSTTYTLTIKGGSAGVKDPAGNALPSDYSWSFTTMALTSAPPVTIQSVTTRTGTGPIAHSLTGVPAGALLVLATTADAFLSDCSVSSSPSLTWMKRVDAGAPSSDNAEIWTAVYPAGGALTITTDWGEEFSQVSLCYVVLNAEPSLSGAFGTGVLQSAPSVTITTSRENSIIFGCTADWKAINGTTRTLRDAATERFYFRDGHFTTYHFTKDATTIGTYTEGVSLPTGQQASTALLEIRSAAGVAGIPPPTVTTQPSSQSICAGNNVNFTSAASGGSPTVQWQSSADGTTWTNINGAVNAVLTFATITADNNKQYRAVWSNSGGPVSSNAATLTINSSPAPTVLVINNCETSVLTAGSFTGSLLWSNGAITPSIVVTDAEIYTVTQTVNGCTSGAGSGGASPKPIPSAPTVMVTNNCGNSVLTAGSFTGSLLWSNGAITPSITVVTGGTYTVTQTVNGCTGAEGSGIAAPINSIVATPQVTVVDNCGTSLLTATAFTGALLWSNGATTPSITVATGGLYTVTQTVNGCTSAPGSGMAVPKATPSIPTVSAINNCGNAVLSAGSYTGSLLWSNGETTPSITVATAGNYSVTQTIDGCTSSAANVEAGPKAIPSAPTVSVINNCGNSVLTAGSYTGSLLWSNGSTASSITVTSGGIYTVTQTTNGCTSTPGGGLAAPLNSAVASPVVNVVNNCGGSMLTATGFTGSLLWSTGETTASITVTTGGAYTVIQTINGCSSAPRSAVAAPKAIPSAPIISVTNNCGSSVLTASSFSGSLLWSTGETSTSITVITGGTHWLTQTVNGCTSGATAATATPKTSPSAPSVNVVNSCGNSVLTAAAYTGSLLWSNGATSSSITVTTPGTYSVTQTFNGCTSLAASGTAAPLNSNVIIPGINVVDNCGNSVLTATGFTGSLLWSTGETTPTITVTIGATYSVTQTVNGCTSAAANAVAAPKIVPPAPGITVLDGCNISTLHASGFTGSLLWNTNETTEVITVTEAGFYIVTQIVNGCVSAAGSTTATPKSTPPAPTVTVVDNCGSSVLTAGSFTGSLLWSNGATLPSITVTGQGVYTVTQTINGCTSAEGSGTAAPLNSSVATPTVTVINGCDNSVLTAAGFTGSLLWSNGAITPSITVNGPGFYTVVQTINGCTSAEGSGMAATLNSLVATPTVSVVNNCNNSVLTAAGFIGSLLWSTGETSSSITVTEGGIYSVTQNYNGCISAAATGIAEPKVIPAAPIITVVNNCESSTLTATAFSGSLLWSNGATSPSITVTTAGAYTVTQTVDGCTSVMGNGVAAPNPIPPMPTVYVINSCGSSYLTASEFTGSLLWETGETTPSIIVTTPATYYSVTQTVNGCTSIPLSVLAEPISVPPAPTVLVTNDCGSSLLTASGYTGSLLWSNGSTTASITVASGGIYTVTQTIDGCSSAETSGIAAPKPIPSTPGVTVVNNCSSSVLTATNFTGSLLWTNGASTSSITVTSGAAYSVTQTMNGCTSAAGSGVAAPLNSSVTTPTVTVVNNCGNSILTAGAFTGSLLWSNGTTTPSITVSTGGVYTVTQTLNGCTSASGGGVAAPKSIPSLTGNQAITVSSGTLLTYSPASTIAGTIFGWSRAAISGISNTAANGVGGITETLVNTTSSPVNVTYVYTLTANGCTNTQNLVVTVDPAQAVNCLMNGSITSSFNNTTIPAGRFIWFSSVMDRGSFSGISGTVTFNVTNSKITFTANNQQYTLNVPNGRIRFDETVTSASTQFINNAWETAVPRGYTNFAFMTGLSYQVPSNLPKNISNVKWTADITADKTGIAIAWKWAAAVYTNFTGHAGLTIKPINGNTQNPFPNSHKAGTPENFTSFLTGGAKGTGGSNYTGNYSGTNSVSCNVSSGQRSVGQLITRATNLQNQLSIRPVDELLVNVMPNPSHTYFNLFITGGNANPVTIKVVDILGQVIERHEKIAAESLLRIGDKWSGGSYFVEVIQDNQRKFVKLIKVN